MTYLARAVNYALGMVSGLQIRHFQGGGSGATTSAKQPASMFWIDIVAFSVMATHYHLVVLVAGFC